MLQGLQSTYHGSCMQLHRSETTQQHAAITTVTARLRAVPKSLHAAMSTTSQKQSALQNCTLSWRQNDNVMALLQQPRWCHTIIRKAVKIHGTQEPEPWSDLGTLEQTEPTLRPLWTTFLKQPINKGAEDVNISFSPLFYQRPWSKMSEMIWITSSVWAVLTRWKYVLETKCTVDTCKPQYNSTFLSHLPHVTSLDWQLGPKHKPRQTQLETRLRSTEPDINFLWKLSELQMVIIMRRESVKSILIKDV